MTQIETLAILDLDSGTYFPAANCVIIDTAKLTDEQLEILEEGSDAERCLLADEVGIPWTGM